MFARIALALLCCAGTAAAGWTHEWTERLPVSANVSSKSMKVPGLSVEAQIALAHSNGVWFYHLNCGNEWLDAPERVTAANDSGPYYDAAVAWSLFGIEEPVVAYIKNNRVWVAERQSNGSWNRIMVGDSTLPAYSPDITFNLVDGYSVVYIVEEASNYHLQVATRDFQGFQYSDIEADLGDFGSGASPRIASDLFGLHVLFRGGGPNAYITQHATNTEGPPGIWGVTTLPVPHAENYPGNLFYDVGTGNLHCVTAGSDGWGIPRGIYHHVRDEFGSWTFGELVSGDLPGADPQVCVSIFGQTSIMWQGISGNFYTGELKHGMSHQNWASAIVYNNLGGGYAFAMDSEIGMGYLLMQGEGEILFSQSTQQLNDTPFPLALDISPRILAMDSVAIGSEVTRTISIGGTPRTNMHISNIELLGEGFELVDDLSDTELCDGDDVTLSVRFHPTAEQVYEGYIYISSNAAAGTDTVLLLGNNMFNDAHDVTAPLLFTLRPLYPNPFNGSVNVSFELPRETFVTLDVFDVLGRRVETLVSGSMSAGSHGMQWNAQNNATGVYLFKLDAGGQTVVQKAAYLK